MARAIITGEDIIDNAITGTVLQQNVLQDRARFNDVFEFNRTGSTIDATFKSYAISGGPQFITFDGTYLWVSTQSAGVHKVDPLTGTVLATGISGVSTLRNICWDGTHIWVSSQSDNKIYKLNQADASTAASLSMGGIPFGMCYAPTSTNTDLWVCVKNNDNLQRVYRPTPAIAQSVSVGDNPYDVCFDGSSLWVTVDTDHRIKSVIESSGTVDQNVDTGAGNTPQSICFDGQNIYFTVTSGGGDIVKKITLAGATLATITTGSFGKVIFNGRFVVTTNTSSPYKIQTFSTWQTTAVENSIVTDTSPQGLVYDGTYLWMACSSTICRILL